MKKNVYRAVVFGGVVLILAVLMYKSFDVSHIQARIKERKAHLRSVAVAIEKYGVETLERFGVDARGYSARMKVMVPRYQASVTLRATRVMNGIEELVTVLHDSVFGADEGEVSARAVRQPSGGL